jgi:hypothetical protein
MEFLEIMRADRNAGTANARSLEFRWQYHEFRRIERLERALVAAKRRNGLSALIRGGSRAQDPDAA